MFKLNQAREIPQFQADIATEIEALTSLSFWQWSRLRGVKLEIGENLLAPLGIQMAIAPNF